MTQLPQGPSGDWRAMYAGAAPIVRDVTNFRRTSPDVDQNLLRVTRRGCDDCPTPEETSIMSAYSGLGAIALQAPATYRAIAHARLTDAFAAIAAGSIGPARPVGAMRGLGKGGGGGHGGGGHGGGGHHHGGRGRRGFGPGYGYPAYGYDGGDTYVEVNVGCPAGYTWSAQMQQCVPMQHVVTAQAAMAGLGATAIEESYAARTAAMRGRGQGPASGAERAQALSTAAALKAGAYRGNVGRIVNPPPSRQGGIIRAASMRGALGGLGDLCSDQGAALGFNIANAAGGIVGGLLKATAGDNTGQSAAGGVVADAGAGALKSYQNVCAQQGAAPSPTVNNQAAVDQMQAQINALTNQASYNSAALAAPAPAPASTIAGVPTTTVAVGGGVLLALFLAYKFLL